MLIITIVCKKKKDKKVVKLALLLANFEINLFCLIILNIIYINLKVIFYNCIDFFDLMIINFEIVRFK